LKKEADRTLLHSPLEQKAAPILMQFLLTYRGLWLGEELVKDPWRGQERPCVHQG